MEFEKRYNALNTAQRQAVDTIEGPVMVVAGPGTGKTELLSVRVANILKKTDALPSNILCLTFTDSGAVAMRERLAELLGPAAYKVAVHTFHSFGSEVINQYGEYFYHGAHFRPADELASYEVLTEILDKLPHDSPIASKMNGVYTHLGDLKSTISDLKKSGLTPDEVEKILDRNDAFIEWCKPHLATTFGPRLSKKQFPAIRSLLDKLRDYPETPLELIGYQPLQQLIIASLKQALESAESEDSTKPLSAWKKTYLAKDVHGEPTLRDERASTKLRAASQVYYQYLVVMQKRELYDYDDMILRVVHALEVFAELRFSLQETYQFILVDEFQDTNDAQMRLIWNLTNNPATESRPNLMVVGDDDQAIYRFQGANMSNILDFTTRYRDVAVITLRDNYRSSASILGLARSIIVQGEERLETAMTGIDKTLTPHRNTTHARLEHGQYDSTTEAHAALAERIATDYQANSAASQAVIARNHRQLLALLPHLEARGLPLRYERQENVLDTEPVQQLELVSRVVQYLAEQRFDDANELLPELLAHPAWRIGAHDIWQLSLRAHRSQKFWLEEMIETPGRLQTIAEWLIVASHYAQTESLEYMCDHLFGVSDTQSADTTSEEAAEPFGDKHDEDFVSPYRAFFFPHESLETHPGRYLAWLSALKRIRQVLRDYRPDRSLRLRDLIDCLDMYREMNLSIQARSEVEHDAASITLLSAHKSKGLEFDTVYLLDAQENIWGNGARSRARLIQFPSNLPLAPAGDSADERLRLLYVALTRARDQLILTSARASDTGKELLPIGAIDETLLAPTVHPPLSDAQQIEALRSDWRTPLYDVALATKDQLLRPVLDKYKLSATHLGNFLDVSRGGPELFLLHNLLRFPQAMSPSAAYGSAIHSALQRAHAHLSATGNRRPVEDVLHDFEETIRQFQISDEEFSRLVARGSSALTAFLTQRYDSFTQRQTVERTFGTETIILGEARITGAIDLMDIDDDEKTIFVTDYKTGKAVRTWQGRTDYEKIKLHHYEQQLMFYKLLLENSRQFAGYKVTGGRIEFVEPDTRGEIVLLDYAYDDEKMADFRRLVEAVWRRIQAMEFTAEPGLSMDLAGIMRFESLLIQKI